MKIIDFHTHIYPEKISEKAVKSIGDFYNLPMKCTGTAKELIQLGKKHNIESFVVCSVAVDSKHVESINDYILGEVKEHSEFYGFSTMHIDYEDKIKETERVISKGLKGVKIHPDTQRFNADDKKMLEYYEYLESHAIPILIHCGDYRYGYSHPKRIKNILTMFPNLKVIAAHFGGWSVYDLATEYLKDTNCFFDTSSSFEFMGLKRAQELIKLYGAKRMVFGSDFPMWDTGLELERFLKLDLSDDEKEYILYKNAQEILGE